MLRSRWPLVLAALMSVVTGCGLMGVGTQRIPMTREAQLTRARGVPGAELPFSPGFLWGVSMAGYQVEGGDTTSNWAVADREGRLKESPGKAIDFWNRYEEDFDLAQKMGMTCVRLSLEWSRIEPVRGQFDPAAIQRYHDMLTSLRRRGIQPLVTLSHFAYPAWLDHPLDGKEGGWVHAETPKEFARFAAWAGQEYGADVKYWLTVNEPNTLAILTYLAGQFPPFRINPFHFGIAQDRQMEGHRLAYAALHRVDPDAMVSFNPFVWKGREAEPSMGQVNARVSRVDHLRLLDIAAGLDPSIPGNTLDYVAFDYYYPTSPGDLTKIPSYWNWSVHPEGMYAVSKQLYQRYKLPLLVAENGIATQGDRPREDGWTRPAYLVNHLAQLRRAMAENIPVLGYCHWSLVDNYEWGSFQPSFGLFAIDRRDVNLTRLKTDAVDVYENIARRNALGYDVLERYLGRPASR